MSCSLCILENKINIYEDNDKFIIIDCDTCLVPMSVWKEHTMTITEEDNEIMEKFLKLVANRKYGEDNYIITKDQRQIPDHLHWHSRPK